MTVKSKMKDLPDYAGRSFIFGKLEIPWGHHFDARLDDMSLRSS